MINKQYIGDQPSDGNGFVASDEKRIYSEAYLRNTRRATAPRTPNISQIYMPLKKILYLLSSHRSFILTIKCFPRTTNPLLNILNNTLILCII